MAGKSRNNATTFWQLVDKRGPDECWPFLGFLMPNGYGQYWYLGRKQLVHRLAYTFAVGNIPEGLFILHSCDNRRCCNPQHLRPGTAKENTADMLLRERDGMRRRTYFKGSRSTSAKLREIDVLAIRSAFNPKVGLTKEYERLATLYNVSDSLIWNIIKGVSWTHV